MQRIFSFLFISFITLAISCKKDTNSSTPGNPKPAGVPTEVGVPTGDDGIEKTIGAEGGSLTSPDGRVKINIPAGALSSLQTISITPITNFNPLAIGDAYRFGPHDIKFTKDVTIEFTYNDEEIGNTIPEALGIAYQDSNEIWQARGGVTINKTNKTVKVVTDHFSDWSLFESIYLISSGPVVNVDGTIELEVFSTEDLVIPLDPKEQVALDKKVSVAAKYIKEWKLAGAGNLQTNGPKATYKAPSTVPSAPNPVAVSVTLDLKQKDKFILFRHITIVNDDGDLEVQVGGGGIVKQPSSAAVKDGNGYWLLADRDGDSFGSYIFLVVPNALGTHPYRNPYSNSGPHFQYHVTGGNAYTCAYVDPVAEDLVASGGGITVTDLGEEDGFIKGTYTVSPAGYGEMLLNTIGVTGKFRVRRAPGQ
jgi:hypothetical protein